MHCHRCFRDATLSRGLALSHEIDFGLSAWQSPTVTIGTRLAGALPGRVPMPPPERSWLWRELLLLDASRSAKGDALLSRVGSSRRGTPFGP